MEDLVHFLVVSPHQTCCDVNTHLRAYTDHQRHADADSQIGPLRIAGTTEKECQKRKELVQRHVVFLLQTVHVCVVQLRLHLTALVFQPHHTLYMFVLKLSFLLGNFSVQFI